MGGGQGLWGGAGGGAPSSAPMVAEHSASEPGLPTSHARPSLMSAAPPSRAVSRRTALKICGATCEAEGRRAPQDAADEQEAFDVLSMCYRCAIDVRGAPSCRTRAL